MLLIPAMTLQRRFSDAASLAGLDDDVDTYLTTALVAVVATLLAGVWVVVWMFRAYRTLEQLGLPRRHRQYMTVAGWIIPIANLVIPARILCDLAAGRSVGHARQLRRLAVLWAVAFGGGWLIDRAVTSQLRNAETIDDVRAAMAVGLVAMLVQLMAGAIFIVVMIGTSRGLSDLVQRRAQEPLAVAGAFDEVPSPVRQSTVAVVATSAVAALALVVGVVRYSPTPQLAGAARTDGDSVLVNEVTAGTCLPNLARVLAESDREIYALDTIDCGDLHDGEIVGVEPVIAGDEWPGDAEIITLSDEACRAAFRRYTGKPVDDTPVELYFLHPVERTWPRDNTALCLVLFPHELRTSIEDLDLTNGLPGVPG